MKKLQKRLFLAAKRVIDGPEGAILRN